MCTRMVVCMGGCECARGWGCVRGVVDAHIVPLPSQCLPNTRGRGWSRAEHPLLGASLAGIPGDDAGPTP